MANHVTLGTAYRFFMPLILMTELNVISKSVINAVLARSPDQSVTLAAFHLAFILYFALSSSTDHALTFKLDQLTGAGQAPWWVMLSTCFHFAISRGFVVFPAHFWEVMMPVPTSG